MNGNEKRIHAGFVFKTVPQNTQKPQKKTVEFQHEMRYAVPIQRGKEN